MVPEASGPQEFCRRKTDAICRQDDKIKYHERMLRSYHMSRHAIAEYLVISAAICILFAEYYQYRAMKQIATSAANMEILVANQTMVLRNQQQASANQEVIIRNQLDFKKKMDIK
jgi:hypothetical protein